MKDVSIDIVGPGMKYDGARMTVGGLGKLTSSSNVGLNIG